MKQRASVSAAMVFSLLKYAASIGVEPSEISRAIGLHPEATIYAERRFPDHLFYKLWMEIIERAGDPNFGLHFAENSHVQPAGDILTAVMFNCPTVGEGMEKLARYHGLSTDLIQIRIQPQGNLVHYAWGSTFDNILLDYHISEAVICKLFFTLKILSDGEIPVIETHFRHSEPENSSEHRRIFNCPVGFEQANDEILVRRKDIGCPIPLANLRILQRLEAIAHEMLKELYPPDTWAEQVSLRISKTLLQGEKPGIDAIAQGFAISIRQLQNMLRREETTYQTLLDQVRKEMALVYLNETGTNMYDVAFLLGFSDQSSFNHAFKRWTGYTPKEYQRKITPSGGLIAP